jgi:aspartyl-tRNA synthetase
LELARRESWAKEGDWRFVWVTDFPLLEYSETEKRWTSMHHPFTSPNPEDIDRLESDPGSVRAVAYDVVANGHEVGGGSIRIHRADIQSRIFKVLQLTEEEAREKFGFFLDALQYGTPPHGGIALGFDRIAMLAAGGKSLRDVIAFPKTTSALDLMTGSPSRVTGEQLDELGLRLAKKAEKVPE